MEVDAPCPKCRRNPVDTLDTKGCSQDTYYGYHSNLDIWDCWLKLVRPQHGKYTLSILTPGAPR